MKPKKILFTLFFTQAILNLNANAQSMPHSLQLPNGTSLTTFINQHPSSSITRLAKATVGLLMQGSINGTCTGTAVSENEILTAAHCVRNNANNKELGKQAGDQIGFTTYNGTDNGKLSGTSAKNITIIYPSPDDIEAADMVIIKLNSNISANYKFPYFINKQTDLIANKFYSASDPEHVTIGGDAATRQLLNTMYNKNQPTIYRFSWGAKKIFEVDHTPVCGNEQINLEFDQRDKNRSNNAYKPDEYDQTVVYTDKDSCSYNLENAQDNSRIFNYADFNILTAFDMNGSPTEGGDSGGPVYLCTTMGSSDSCLLAAVHHAGNKIAMTQHVTLANPYFDILQKQW